MIVDIDHVTKVYLPPFIRTNVILLATKACPSTSRTSFQLENTIILASASFEVIHNILLITASIFKKQEAKQRCKKMVYIVNTNSYNQKTLLMY